VESLNGRRVSKFSLDTRFKTPGGDALMVLVGLTPWPSEHALVWPRSG
jgi:hypothetical protein